MQTDSSISLKLGDYMGTTLRTKSKPGHIAMIECYNRGFRHTYRHLSNRTARGLGPREFLGLDEAASVQIGVGYEMLGQV